MDGHRRPPQRKYLYLTQVDRTWNQRISETHYRSGPTKVVEVPVEKVGEKPIVVTEVAKPDSWTAFAADFRAKLTRGEVVAAADMLRSYVPAAGETAPTGLKELQNEFRSVAVARLKELANARCQDRRFADAHDSLRAFSTAESVKAVLDPAAAADGLRTVRPLIRDAEDEYHYTQIRTLAADGPTADGTLKQHIDAYLALVEPPGRMLAEVQKLAEYRKAAKEGYPGKAVVTVEWGPRIALDGIQSNSNLGTVRTVSQ